jgi:hypothetical protein
VRERENGNPGCSMVSMPPPGIPQVTVLSAGPDEAPHNSVVYWVSFPNPVKYVLYMNQIERIDF